MLFKGGSALVWNFLLCVTITRPLSRALVPPPVGRQHISATSSRTTKINSCTVALNGFFLNRKLVIILSSSSTNRQEDEATSPPSSVPTTTRSVTDPSSLTTTSPSSSGSSSSSPSLSSPAFYDQVVLQVRAGSGGAGATTFETQSQQQQGSPNGGNGGRGGHVMLQVDADLNTLAGLAKLVNRQKNAVVVRAENGHNGQRKRSGPPGKDAVLRVPPGTIVEELRNEDEWVEVGRLALLKPQSASSSFDDNDNDADDEPSCLMVAQGGRGGDGNAVYATGRRGSTNKSVHRAGPTAGQRKTLRLTLQFLADVAVIGVPNAGKSTFLAAVTRAQPKIANYPFTTIVPNLGVWIDDEVSDGINRREKLVLCDVPGLVNGASRGIGLGHEFLRHVERCSVMVHLVDATSPTAVEDYEMINRELTQYAGGILATKPQVVVVNKLDLLCSSDNDEASLSSSQERRDDLHERLIKVMPHSRLLWMSAKERQGVDQVMRKLAAFVRKVNQADNAET